MIKIKKAPEKFVYCFPFGGFNDAAHQLMYNYHYCKKYNRKLIADMKFSDFQENFGDHFHLDGVFFEGDVSNVINIENVYPNWVRDIPNLKFAWSNTHLNMIETNHGKLMNFDHNIDYPERLLVEVNCRITGDNADEFFQMFPPKKHILEPLKDRYSRLPEGYTSVHIRNTDYTSNVSQFINEHKKDFEGKNIFLASDNSETIKEFKDSVNANIYGFSNIPTFNKNHPRGGGIHRYEVDNKRELNIDSLVDLILLSLGKEYYFSCPKSGYTRSAKKMHQDANFKHYILQKMEQL